MAEALEATDEVEFDGDPDLLIASRDFEKVADARINAGYLEGVEAGKQHGLNEGFHHGFVRGIRHTIHWSVLRGKISALQAYISKLANAEDPLSAYSQANVQLCELLKVVKDGETKWSGQMAAEEMEAYRLTCSQLLHDNNESQEPSTSAQPSTTLIELLSLEKLGAQDELQEIQRRLEHLATLLKQP